MIPTWGSSPKAQDDPTTIDEAIALAITAHEEDPTAHLGAGESIEQHKTNEIIDHPAFSVLDDKLAYDRNSFDLNMSDLSRFDVSAGVESMGLDTAFFSSPNSSSPRWLYGSAGDMITADVFYYTKNARFQTEIMLISNANQLGYILVGYRDESEGFGFKILNNKLYGFYFNSSHVEQTVEIATITAYAVYKLEARVSYSDKIDFFINNVLIASFSGISLPATNGYVWNLPWIDFKSTTTTTKEFYIRKFYWEAEL